MSIPIANGAQLEEAKKDAQLGIMTFSVGELGRLAIFNVSGREVYAEIRKSPEDGIELFCGEVDSNHPLMRFRITERKRP
jgi:hypothetical protein